MNPRTFCRTLALATLAMQAAAPRYAADVVHPTPTDAVHPAISQNRALKIARLRVAENEHRKTVEHSAYLPEIANESKAYITDLQFVDIPAGGFGDVTGVPIPARQITLPQGRLTFYSSGTQISQLLTQVIRIHQANRIAAAEVAISSADVQRAENQVALNVHSLYFGILIARLQKQAAEWRPNEDKPLPPATKPRRIFCRRALAISWLGRNWSKLSDEPLDSEEPNYGCDSRE